MEILIQSSGDLLITVYDQYKVLVFPIMTIALVIFTNFFYRRF